MSQEHSHGAALVPGPEVARTLDSWIVPANGPDPPAHPGDRPASPLVDDRERVFAKQVPERELWRGARDSPAHCQSELGRVPQADRSRSLPEPIGIRSGGLAVP